MLNCKSATEKVKTQQQIAKHNKKTHNNKTQKQITKLNGRKKQSKTTTEKQNTQQQIGKHNKEKQTHIRKMIKYNN